MTTTPPGAVDLSNCDREPIHAPGSIQPHGTLLILDEADLRIAHAGRNAGTVLGRRAEDLIGTGIADWLGVDFGRLIRESLDHPAIDQAPQLLRTLSMDFAGREAEFDAIIHRGADGLILEFEPSGLGGSRADSWAEAGPFARDILNRLDQATTIEALCSLVAAEIRRLIGFDRTLVYRFDDGWNGTVIAEDRNENLPSYLDMRFPASDIPAPARELYRTNRVRSIFDVGHAPVPIVPEGREGQPIDLRFSTLRAVSPVHIEYMINMGTASSVSISILREGALWGLIACHNREPRFVPFRDRAACDFIGQVFSIQLAAKTQRIESELRIGRKAIHSRLLAAMTEEEDFVAGLEKHGDELLKLTDATGAAVLNEGRTVLIGVTPGPEEVERIADWLVREGRDDLVVRESLEGEVLGASDFKDEASGLIAISISKLHRGFILWFRPEVIRTVAWGGDPSKAMVAEEGGRIHPRRSFESWLETVRFQSKPWLDSEIEAASELRHSIVGIVLRHAEERAQFSTELERSNKELEAFSYSVSHDLRAPFRHIVGYSDMLREEEGDRLSAEGRRYLNTIIDAAQNAGTLVDNLLAFSRMGRTTIHPVPIDMNILANEVVREAMMEAGGRSITWKIDPLPTIEGDLMMIRLALGNLASNAVKYTRNRPEAVVEIGARAAGPEIIFHVRDNGIGFDMRYVDKLFGVFQRLHRQEDFEGTGIGLANVRRIMGRHGGRAWAEGEPDRGAAFFFALPRSVAETTDGTRGRG
ncbi:ATP-binding protein [Tundrisphaera sp. TA3]|uniref:ATP-binding protein n=1 Tax=Tundrisphaera sp. TA3 TaxID=3435775 RepID=UPI003EC0AFE0